MGIFLVSCFVFVAACSNMYNFQSSDPFAGLIQPLTDKANWLLNNGSTASSGTGPAQDHTLGTLAGGCCG